jgi:hypothetical protein
LRLSNAFIWHALVIATAGAMLAVTALPASVWRQAQVGPTYRGFDGSLLSINEKNEYAAKPGVVIVSPSAIQIGAEPGSLPSVHLLTTSASSFDVSFKVRIDHASESAIPLKIGLWSPYTKSGYYVAFDPAPLNSISSETVIDGMLGQTLTGGTVTRQLRGRYSLGQTYDLAVRVDKKAGRITYDLSGADLASPIHLTTTGSDPNRLANELRLTLTASAASASGRSRASLQEYELTLPPEAGGALKIDDSRATFLLGALGLAGLALFVVAAAGRRPNSALVGTIVRRLNRRGLLFGAGVATVVAVLNALLFRLGVAPFDMTSQAIWSYLAASYGPASVYVLGPFVSVAKAFNGMPLDAAVFPYEPVMVYLFAFDGLVARLLESNQVVYLIKAVNVAFGLIDALLIFGIMKKLGISGRWSVAGAALFILNPAVWFSMSIWGANHVTSLSFVLLAILLAEYDHPVGAWLALGIGTFTRPQMLVFGLIVGAVFLLRFSIRRNAYAVAWTVIVIFLLLVPFTIQTSPSLPLDLLSSVVRVQALGGNEQGLSSVSLDAYSLWPLVTFVAAGRTSLDRMFYPSNSTLLGQLSYQHAGMILTALVLAGAIALLVARRRSVADGGYVPIVAIGIGGFLMFMTGLAATHFILALPFILLSRRWLGPPAYLSIIAGWSATTLIAMYGILAVDLAKADYLQAPLFGQTGSLSHLSSWIAELYSSDRFITVGVVVNVAVLLTLLVAIARSLRGEQDASALVSASALEPAVGKGLPDVYASHRP